MKSFELLKGKDFAALQTSDDEYQTSKNGE